MNEFIKLYNIDNSLGFCNDIIELFNNEEQHDGISGAGYNPSIKSTKDFKIPSISCNYTGKYHKEWVNIDNNLHSMISPLISQYVEEINNTLNPKNDWVYIRPRELHDTGHQIQKYKKNYGHYKAKHNDFSILKNTNYYRILTYILYLNTVEEGGETVFYENYKIKPTAGTLVIFPALWTYPHCGNMPISDDKYIITGWIYTKDHTVEDDI